MLFLLSHLYKHLCSSWHCRFINRTITLKTWIWILRSVIKWVKQYSTLKLFTHCFSICQILFVVQYLFGQIALISIHSPTHCICINRFLMFEIIGQLLHASLIADVNTIDLCEMLIYIKLCTKNVTHFVWENSGQLFCLVFVEHFFE